MERLKSFLSDPDESGSPNINQAVIQPFTEKASNIPGKYSIPMSDSIMETESFQIKTDDIWISNLDSLSYPLEFLKPHDTDSRILQNMVTMSGGSKPLSVSTVVTLSSTYFGQSRLDTIDVIFSIAETKVFLNLFANVDVSAFMGLHLGNIRNPYCWLATIPSSSLYNKNRSNAIVKKFQLLASDFTFDGKCKSCDTSGFEELTSILSALKVSGASTEMFEFLKTLAEEFLEGHAVQAFIDAHLEKAVISCESGEGPDINLNTDDFMSLILQPKYAEQIVFFGLVMFQVVSIVVSSNFQSDDFKPIPIPSNEDYKIDFDKNVLFDFTNPTSDIGSIIEFVIQNVNTVLSSIPNTKDNILTQSSLFDQDGVFTMETNEISLSIFTLESISIQGLDSITDIDPITPIAPQILQGGLTLSRMSVKANIAIDVSSISSMINEDRKLGNDEVEHMTISLSLHDLKAGISLLLGIDENILGNINLGSLLNSENIVPCLLSSVVSTNITAMELSVGGIDEIKLSGLLSDDLKAKLKQSWEALTNAYDSDMTESITPIISSMLPSFLNEIVKEYLGNDANMECPVYDNEGKPRFMDFRDLFYNSSMSEALGGSGTEPYGNLASILMERLKSFLSDPDESGSPNINQAVIQPYTVFQSDETGVLFFPGQLFSSSYNIDDLGGSSNDVLTLSLFDVRIANLDSFGYPMNILVPDSSVPYIVNNAASLGDEKPLLLSSRLLFAVQGDNSNIYNEMEITLEISNLTMLLSLMAKVSTDKLLSLAVQNLRKPYCWIATIPPPDLNEFGVRDIAVNATASLTELDSFVESLHTSVNCLSCTGQSFETFTSMISSDDGKSESTMLGNLLLNMTKDFILSEMFQTEIDRLLVQASERCIHEGEGDYKQAKYESFSRPLVTSNSMKITIALGVVLFAVVIMMILSYYCTRCTVSRKNKDSLSGLSYKEINQIYTQQKQKDEREIELCRVTTSMIFSHEIPLIIRFSMPIVIMLNIALFLSGHFSLGATLKLDIQLAGDKLIIQDFFEFSIASSIIDMWNIKLYSLAVIIFSCSVLWPYTKQAILLVLWVAPPSRIGVHRRTSLFLTLDSLGKWSMTDIYVLVMVLVVFRISVLSPSGSELIPEDFYSLDGKKLANASLNEKNNQLNI